MKCVESCVAVRHIQVVSTCLLVVPTPKSAGLRELEFLFSRIFKCQAMTPPNRAIGQLSEGTFESEATWWSVPGERPERPIEPLEQDLTLGAAVGLFSLLGGRLWGTNGDLKARGFKSYSCTQSLLVLWASTAILQAWG